MQLELIKSKKNSYKLISKSTQKHPLLIQLAGLIKYANKFSPLKLGIYSIHSGEFSTHITVYSYVSNRSEKMNKKKYYKWLNGKAQLKGLPSPEKVWRPIDPNKNKDENILAFLEI